MNKPKGGKKSKERATVSRERRLALALAEVLDLATEKESGADERVIGAHVLLADLGYSNLESVSSRVKYLNEQLTVAIAAGDGKEIARLGVELQRAQQGKEPTAVKVKAAAKE